jgi:hypothetical protein
VSQVLLLVKKGALLEQLEAVLLDFLLVVIFQNERESFLLNSKQLLKKSSWCKNMAVPS